MASYTQVDRPLRIDTALGEDVLLLNALSGSEAMSQPYGFQVELLSVQPDIDAAAILRTPVLVTLRLPDGAERHIHGIVSRFAQLGMRDDLVFYRAEIVPWLWFLTLSRESRIYQELTITDILEEVFKRTGYSDYEFRLTRNYPQRVYCVQYRETHLSFVSRLMEEEGIYYYFEHSADKHVLVIADHNGSNPDIPGATTLRYAPQSRLEESVITEFEHEFVVRSGKVSLRDYNFETPTVTLAATLGEEHEEIYDYPGMYGALDEGERLARLQLEAEECDRQVVRAVSDSSALIAGHQFTLKEHYRADANGKYLITEVQHLASTGDYRGWDATAGLSYENTFTCIPAGTPYRPARQTQRPVIQGAQTAVVVGPPGEEIYVDKYGRIKVQFHWDRDGQRNENSSCWVRVATPWGGKGWGGVTLPRIGNEVIVGFEEGDPDRPLVLGSVYNADQMPPFDLPGAGIQMGMKSRSSPGGGGNNEISLTDTKGKELITIHGQYDMNTTVEHDETVEIKNNRKANVGVDETLSVGNDQTISIGNDRTEQVGNNETIGIGNDRGTTVGGSDTLTVSLNRSHSVAINEAINVGAAQEVSVGGIRAVTVGVNQSTSVGRNMSTTAGGNHSTTVGGDRSGSIAKNDSLKVGKKLVIDAGDEITIKTGKASIAMKKDGTIVIQGKDLTLKGSGKMDVKISKDIKMKGKKILQN